MAVTNDTDPLMAQDGAETPDGVPTGQDVPDQPLVGAGEDPADAVEDPQVHTQMQLPPPMANIANVLHSNVTLEEQSRLSTQLHTF